MVRHRKCGEKLVTVAMGAVRLPESWGHPRPYRQLLALPNKST